MGRNRRGRAHFRLCALMSAFPSTNTLYVKTVFRLKLDLCVYDFVCLTIHIRSFLKHSDFKENATEFSIKKYMDSQTLTILFAPVHFKFENAQILVTPIVYIKKKQQDGVTFHTLSKFPSI